MYRMNAMFDVNDFAIEHHHVIQRLDGIGHSKKNAINCNWSFSWTKMDQLNNDSGPDAWVYA